MKKKLKLKRLDVKSFVTNQDDFNSETVKGGLFPSGPTTVLNTNPNICTLNVNGCGGGTTTGNVLSIDIVCPPQPTLYIGCNEVSVVPCQIPTLVRRLTGC